jgi:CheY-like chemotaxis protein
LQLRILYVEDNPDDQAIMKRTLMKYLPIDYDLSIAKTCAEGFETIEKNDFDILILDYRLPDMTGLDFLKELRKKQFHKPIIFVTSKGSEKIAVEAMKVGAKDYIVKDDIASGQLVESLSEILLETSIPENINIEVAKQIYQILSENQKIRINIGSEPFSEPKCSVPTNELLKALNMMTEKSILIAEETGTAISCPQCNSLAVSFSLKCPDCGIGSMEKGEALEHMTCGHIGFRSEFEQTNKELVCPKCRKTLKMIGVDYKKVENWYKCSRNHLFNVPKITFGCNTCGKEFPLNEASLQPLHQYSLSVSGAEALRLSLLAHVISNKITPKIKNPENIGEESKLAEQTKP